MSKNYPLPLERHQTPAPLILDLRGFSVRRLYREFFLVVVVSLAACGRSRSN